MVWVVLIKVNCSPMSSPKNDAFDLFVVDLLRIAEKWHKSYNYVNIALFVVLYLTLVFLDILLVYGLL